MADIMVNVGDPIEPAEAERLEDFLLACNGFDKVWREKMRCSGDGARRLGECLVLADEHRRKTGLAYGFYLQMSEPGCREATRVANERWLTGEGMRGKIG